MIEKCEKIQFAKRKGMTRGSDKSNAKSLISQPTQFQQVIETRRKISIQRYKDYLVEEERALLYYIVNLILLDQYNFVDSLIKKYFLRMKTCSEVFKGNIRRFQAIAQSRLLIMQNEMKKLTNLHNQQEFVSAKTDEIEKIIRHAIKQF